METTVETFRLVGCIRVHPPLRAGEFEYLMAFAESRRWRRPDGPYAVPANPLAECLDPGLDLAAYSAPADGQPSLECSWAPGHGGRALVPARTGGECGSATPDIVARWLGYLRDNFLRSDANAGMSGSDPAGLFDGFGFDHVLDGAAAVCSDSTGVVTMISVVSNHLTVRAVGAGWESAAAVSPAHRLSTPESEVLVQTSGV